MTEKRKFLRFKTPLTAFCNIDKEKNKAPYKLGKITKEGRVIVFDKKLGESDEINLSMEGPGDNIPKFPSCQVAWQNQIPRDNVYETGVRFININGVDKNRLLEYIYLQWLKLLDKK